MIRFVLLLFALAVFVMIAVTLIISTLIFLAMACAIGIPLYLMAQHWMRDRGMAAPRLTPMDRLKNLYVEGKIDLFEFERRVAHLISIEH